MLHFSVIFFRLFVYLSLSPLIMSLIGVGGAQLIHFVQKLNDA